MKGLKRITSIVLALAMFATGIAISGPTTVKADTATDNWKANGIVSPKQDKLIGAGYIDVKWDNTLTDVSQYKSFMFDGDLKSNSITFIRQDYEYRVLYNTGK